MVQELLARYDQVIPGILKGGLLVRRVEVAREKLMAEELVFTTQSI